MATSGDDLIIYGDQYGNNNLVNLELTLINPYSGEEVTINGEYNYVAGFYADGLEGYDVLSMSGYGDVLFAQHPATNAQALQNIEQINASLGNDVIILASSLYNINGVTVLASLGDDIIWGNNGDDVLNGSSGSDHLVGGGGNDSVLGGNDNDYLNGGTGADLLQGDGGNDTLRYTADDVWGEGYSVSASGGVAVTDAGSLISLEGKNRSFDRFSGGANTDKLIMTDGADALLLEDHISASYNNVLAGRVSGIEEIDAGGGDDIIDLLAVTYNYVTDVKIIGGTGNDWIRSGSQNDTISGGAGNDTLYGGEGEDVFVIELGADTDTVMDFNLDADKIDVSAFSAAFSFARLSLAASGGDALINLAGGVQVVLAGISPASLNAGHFIFAPATIVTGSGLVQGTEASDIITGQASGDRIEGLGGDDDLYGGAGHDTIFGGDGDDIIKGEDGRDMIYGGAGADNMDGGAGVDALRYDHDTVGVTVSLATGRGYGGEAEGDVFKGFEALYGGSGNDTLTGSSTADTIYGNAGHDTIKGGAKDDILYGGDGDDILNGEAGTDKLYGNAGNDTLIASDGLDIMTGGEGQDKFVFMSGTGTDLVTDFNLLEDKIDLSNFAQIDSIAQLDITQAGLETRISVVNGSALILLSNINMADLTNDHFIFAAPPPVNVINGSGTLNGGAGKDIITGSAGNDKLVGFGGNDELYGGAGNDNLYGGDGDDLIQGGDGKDHVYGGAGADTLNGGASNDYLHYDSDTVGVTVNLATGRGYGGEAEGDIISGFENVYGGSGNDTLIGSSSVDILYGNGGNDRLEGGAKNDTLYGGAGADTFVLALGSVDTVGDFSVAQADRLDISDILKGFEPDTSDINQFIRTVTSGTGTSVEVDANGAVGGQSWTKVATLSNVTGLSVDDLYANGQIIV